MRPGVAVSSTRQTSCGAFFWTPMMRKRVAISPETILVHTALENAFQETVQNMLMDSQPGEERLLLVTVADANGGAVLPANTVLD